MPCWELSPFKGNSELPSRWDMWSFPGGYTPFGFQTPGLWRYDWTPKNIPTKHQTSGGIWKTRVHFMSPTAGFNVRSRNSIIHSWNSSCGKSMNLQVIKISGTLETSISQTPNVWSIYSMYIYIIFIQYTYIILKSIPTFTPKNCQKILVHSAARPTDLFRIQKDLWGHFYLVVEPPTPLKKTYAPRNGFIFPKVWGGNKNIFWNYWWFRNPAPPGIYIKLCK